MIDTDFAGVIHPWSGRFYSLWDTGYAKIHIPIIASVSEHQPTTWVSFFFDLHILVCAFPAGVWYCVKDINDERVFGETFSTYKIQENWAYKSSWFEFNLINYQIYIFGFFSLYSYFVCHFCQLLCRSDGTSHVNSNPSCVCSGSHCFLQDFWDLSQRRYTKIF